MINSSFNLKVLEKLNWRLHSPFQLPYEVACVATLTFSLTPTPFQFVLRLDLATRWCFGWTLQRQESRHLERVSRVLSTQKIERFDLTRFSRTSIHAVRRVRVQGNKSVIESILSSSSSYGNASVHSCLVPHGGVRSFSISFFSLSSSSSVEIQPGYGTDNDIDTDGNKANDLWWRFIAVFIAALQGPRLPRHVRCYFSSRVGYSVLCVS